MKYKRFEDLPVWKAAADLCADIMTWSSDSSLRSKGDFANQLQRAVLSISNNIAEGFERGTNNELLKFLSYALGSAGEVRSMLLVMRRITSLEGKQSTIDTFIPQVESISRQLRAWSEHLQDSELRGIRHLNETTRRESAIQSRQAEWRERQREFMAAKEAEILRALHERQQRESQNTGLKEMESGD